jgi:hypothetical protein
MLDMLEAWRGADVSCVQGLLVWPQNQPSRRLNEIVIVLQVGLTAWPERSDRVARGASGSFEVEDTRCDHVQGLHQG